MPHDQLTGARPTTTMVDIEARLRLRRGATGTKRAREAGSKVDEKLYTRPGDVISSAHLRKGGSTSVRPDAFAAKADSISWRYWLLGPPAVLTGYSRYLLRRATPGACPSDGQPAWPGRLADLSDKGACLAPANELAADMRALLRVQVGLAYCSQLPRASS